MKKKHEKLLENFNSKLIRVLQKDGIDENKFQEMMQEESTEEVRAEISETMYAAGLLIRIIREDQNLSIKQLADLAELDEELIKGVEENTYDPFLSEIYDIATALGITVPDLFSVVQKALEARPGSCSANTEPPKAA